MKKHAAILALLVLCTCDGHDVEPPLCKDDANLPDSCPPVDECFEQCAADPSFGWSMPVLLWAGPQLMAPDCPAEHAGAPAYEGYADRVATECAFCACDPPIGACELPSSITISTAPCDVSGGITHSLAGLDPDPNVCNIQNGVGAEFGARSVTVDPYRMIESGCTPVEGPPTSKNGAMMWSVFARACAGTAPGRCLDPSLPCASSAGASPGFSQCIYRPGDHDCPAIYPTRRIFYEDAMDARTCAACSCGPPTQSYCSAILKIYEDPFCSDSIFGALLYSFAPYCYNLSPDKAVLSKRLTSALTYEPGSCEPSGGEPVGSVELLGPTTFCCQE